MARTSYTSSTPDEQCFTSVFAFILFSRGRQTLRVREHKVLGPYVDGLSRLAVASYKVKVFISNTAA